MLRGPLNNRYFVGFRRFDENNRNLSNLSLSLNDSWMRLRGEQRISDWQAFRKSDLPGTFAELLIGRGGGIVVCILALYSDNPSLNTTLLLDISVLY